MSPISIFSPVIIYEISFVYQNLASLRKRWGSITSTSSLGDTSYKCVLVKDKEWKKRSVIIIFLAFVVFVHDFRVIDIFNKKFFF